MRLLHIDSGREMRGGQWQALRLVQGLAAAGEEVLLLAPAGSPLYVKANDLNLDVRPLRPLAVAQLARKACLLHAHDAHSHTLAALLAPRRPLVVARLVAFPIRSRWKYRRASHYVAVSSFVRNVLVAGGVASSRISIVYDGVPLAAAAPPGSHILSPGLDDPLKGRRLVEEAACLAGVPVSFSFNLEADLAGAALFVYITAAEGLGSAVLMAMSAGVPVIASRVGGLPEIVEHGENGLLVDNTARGVATAIRRLLDDPALARRLGAEGRHTVERRFTVDAMVRGTIDVYRKLG
jgi:glycosyltransferase involved in cell wall biosynthesis